MALVGTQWQRVSGVLSVCAAIAVIGLMLVPLGPKTEAPIETKPAAMKNSTIALERFLPEPVAPAVVFLPAPPGPIFSAEPAVGEEVFVQESEIPMAPKVVPLKPISMPAVAENQSARPVIPLRPASPEPVPAPIRSALEPTPISNSSPTGVPRTVKLATPVPTVPRPILSPIQPVAATARSAKPNADLAEGRVLLKILEHGKGPVIEIAWPESTSQRERLFGRLIVCHGMVGALMDRKGWVFIDDGPRGRAWPMNMDRYSGYVRQADGALTDHERAGLQRIRNHHQQIMSATPVRLFPRQVDARLLGGLASAVGPEYRAAKNIRAAYVLRGGQVWIDNIQADGKAVGGGFSLPAVARECRA